MDDNDGEGYDVEAYDMAYATYMDARRRFQDLKPVVALQEPSTAASSTSCNKGATKSIGKGKGGKKGKGKAVFRYQKPPGEAADPKGRSEHALRSCGQFFSERAAT